MLASVTIKNSSGGAASGVPITFDVIQGGGSVGSSASAQAVVLTGADGKATATWKMGTGVGVNLLRASRTSTDAVVFTATAKPGPAVALALATRPSASVQNGANFVVQPVVKVVDQFGNTDTTAAGTMSVTITALPAGSVPQLLNGSRPIVNGVATFSALQLNGKPGAYTLQFSDNVRSVTDAVALGTGAPRRLKLSTLAKQGIVNGVALDTVPVVQLQDAGGNDVSVRPGLVVTVTSSVGSVSAGNTATTDTVTGKASFGGMAMTGPTGPVTLTFRDQASALAADSQTVALAPSGVPFSVTIGTQPSNVDNDVAISPAPTVTVRDIGGNPVGSATVTVVASGATVLAGGTQSTNAQGVATFAGLRLSGLAGQYALTFSSTPAAPRTSNAFTLRTGVATSLQFATAPSATVANAVALATQPALRAVDVGGNTDTTVNGSTLSVTSPGLTGSNNTALFVKGVATFNALSFTGPVGSYTLTFSDGTRPGLPTALSLTVGSPVALRFATAPSGSANVLVPLATQPVVRVVDAGDNTVASVNSTPGGVPPIVVTAPGLTPTNGSASVVNGVATFSGLSFNGIAGSSYTLTFSTTFGVGQVLTQIQAPLALNGGSAAAIQFVTPPSATAANAVPLTQQPVVKVVDGAGNTLTNFSGTVTASASGGISGSNASATFVNGVATFAGLSFTGTVGTYTLTFSDGTRTVTNSLTLGLGQPAALQFVTPPSASAANGAVLATQPAVRVVDAGGNTVTTLSSGQITVSAPNLTTGSANMSAGVASFSGLSFAGPAATYTLNFSDGTRTLSTATNGFTLTVGAPVALAFATAPSASAASGVALAQQPVVKVVDVGGNTVTSVNSSVTVTVTATGLTPTSNTASFTSGVATFSGLKFTGAIGSYTLSFSDGTRPALTSSFSVGTGGQVAALAFGTAPSTSAAYGITLATQPVVRAVDLGGNTVTSATGTVTVSAPGLTAASGTAPLVNGVATFSGLSFTGTVGNYTLTFSDGTHTTTSAFALTPGAATALQFVATPSAAAANAATLVTQPVVKVVDAGGNTLTGLSTGSITATASGLTATNGTASIVNGVATFSGLSFTGTIGNFTLTFSDGTRSTTNAFTLNVGAAAALQFVTPPSASAANGVALATQPVVKVVDAGGNTLTGLNAGSITVTASGLTSSNGTASIASGVATFSGLLFTGSTGSYTLIFTDGVRNVTNPITITVGQAVAVRFVTAPPISAQYGATLSPQPQVEVVDAGGVRVTTASGTMSIANISGWTGSNASATIVNGLATFSGLSFTGLATNGLLIFSDGTRTVNSSFTLTPGSASALQFGTAPPASAQSGLAVSPQPTVKVVDAGGNTVTSVNTGSVTVAVPGLAATGGSASIVNGVATFSSLSFTGSVGGYTLTFTDGTRSIPSPMTLTPGSASAIQFVTAPSGTAANAVALATQPVVKVVDANGNTLTGLNTGSMTVTAPGLTVANGSANIVNGVATFSGLSFTGTIGNYTLTFSDGTRSTTNAFSLTVGSASAVQFVTAPSGTAANAVALATQPVVKVVDAGGNTLTGLNTGSISVTASGLTATNGTTTIVNGVATFSGLRFTGPATGYTLTFSDGTRSTTNGFTLTVGVAAALQFVTPPSASAQSGVDLATQPVLRVVDAGGNTVTSVNTGSITVTATGLVPTNGSASISSGQATFSALSFAGSVGNYTLTFSDGTRSVTRAFTIDP